MKQVLLITGVAVLAVSAIVALFAINQVRQQQVELTARLESRTQVLAESLAESIEPSFSTRSIASMQRIVDRFVSNERLAGLGIFGSDGAQKVSKDLRLPSDEKFITNVMNSGDPHGEYVREASNSYYVYAIPLREDDRIVGALATVQDVSYIDQNIASIWKDNAISLLSQIILFAAVIFILVRFVFFRSVYKIVESLQRARRGDFDEEVTGGTSFFKPLVGEITKVTQSLRQARQIASEEARMRLEKLDTPWTEARLREFVKAHLKGRTVFMLTHLEPFVHKKVKNAVQWKVPASGLITAIEPVMEACGGLWIATGSGDADKETADEEGKLRVPPDEPRYTLKRVWLSDQERQRYDRGFCGESLWPLFHMMHTRPTFRPEEWDEYRKVNSKFAKILLREIKDVQQPLVLIQDFQFTLLPALIKRSRPDAQIGLFWHITWPSAEIFSTCPWKKEILEGMLGADVIGFHTQQFCNNFIETASKEIEMRADFEQFSITRNGHTSYIKPFPAGTTFANGEPVRTEKANRDILKSYGITTPYVGLGVERMDAIKGLLERFKAIEMFFEMYPQFKEQFTFLQVTAPTNPKVESRRLFSDKVKSEAERINKKLGTKTWQPIVHVDRQHTHEEIRPLYEAADFFTVTSLHDGMNLVSKEFVASRSDHTGVLILSQFTGAARELKDAILVNPYDIRETAEAIHTALSMPKDEQERRMKKMREAVKNYNIYRWSAEFIKAVTSLG